MKFACCPPAAGAGIMQVSIRPITMKGIPLRLKLFTMEVFLEEPRSRRGGANVDEEAAVDEVVGHVQVLDVVVGVIVEPWRVVLKITPWRSKALLPGRNDSGGGIPVQNVEARVVSSMMNTTA